MLPVNEPSFWKKRLTDAKKNGHLHYSVYLANPTLWKKIYEAHKAIIETLIKEDDWVLDAGCGYGRLAPLFKNYVGVDISPDFIAIAQKDQTKQFILGDLKNLTFNDNTFDWAVCTSIKAMVEDNLGKEEWELMLKELKRVAKNVLILEYGDTIKGNPENYEVL